MVDVSAKRPTERIALAKATLKVGKAFSFILKSICFFCLQVTAEIMRQMRARTLQKGDVRAVAQIAGIHAAKQTANLIPLCHSLPLADVQLRAFADEVRFFFALLFLH